MIKVTEVISKNKLWAWTPVILYMGLIWLISSFPPSGVADWIYRFPFQDKGVHFIEFGGLALLWYRALHLTWPFRSKWRHGLLAVMITVAWGMLDEIHQAFIPLREPDGKDVLADGLGAIVFVFSYLLLTTRMRREKS